MITMNPGDRVRISGAAGSVDGEVMSVASPWELPDLPELEAGPARTVLLEWAIVRVAMISHYYDDQPVMFAALQTETGTWFDLHGQELSISILPASAPTPAKPRGGSRRAHSCAPRGLRATGSRSLPPPSKGLLP